MHRVLVACCLLVATVLAVRADDEKKKPADEFKSIMEAAVKDYRAAKSDEEKEKILTACADKLFDLAKNHAKDPVAVQAMLQVYGMPLKGNSRTRLQGKALEVLKKDHLKSKAIGDAVRSLAGRGDEELISFVKLVMEQNPDKKVQAKACQALQKAREQMAKMANQLKENEDLKGNVEKVRGKEFVKNLVDNAEKFDKEAKEYGKLLKDKYSDIIVDLSVGRPAPEVISEDLVGKKVKLSDLKGKVVVLDIWATWCGPCRAMIPHTRELVKKMEGKPFVFVSISADAKKETVTNFIKETPMPWTHWWNGATGGIVADWNVEYYPTIYVLDHKGIIRYKDVRNKEMDQAVEKLVKEMEGEKKG